MSDPFARIEALVSSVSGARRAFRNFGNDPSDLEEFFAYYEDEADRARVIARARAAAAEVIATAAAIGDDDAARIHLVRSLTAAARELGASPAAADPSFDPAPLKAALTPPAAAAPGTARGRDAVEAPSDGDRGRAAAEAAALLAFLARKPDDRTLVDAFAARVTGVTKSRGGAKITCGRTVVTCTPPRKPGRAVPKSYAGVARVFGSVTWNAGAGPVGFVGVDAVGRIARSGWEPEALEEGDNRLCALSRAKKAGRRALRVLVRLELDSLRPDTPIEERRARPRLRIARRLQVGPAPIARRARRRGRAATPPAGRSPRSAGSSAMSTRDAASPRQRTSKRSRFMTLVHAATKSRTSSSPPASA
ncbi:MAG: hypothetical protein U0235_00475 [Polyangiaceae bacterium]